MKSLAAAVILVVGAAVLLVSVVGRGATIEPCVDAPFDPLCVSVAFPTSSSSLATSDVPLASASLAPTLEPAPTQPVEYTFNDEFEGATLGHDWGNHWGTVKPSRWSRSHAKIVDGVLTLTAERTGAAWEGALVDTFDQFRQRYGFFSARVKVPEGRGLWATFWLAEDWAKSGIEIDIMEVCANLPGQHDGNDSTLVHQILHDASGNISASHGERFPDLTAGWHIFALDWQPESMKFYRDGVEFWRLDDASKIPSVPMAVILSLTTGNWCSKPDGTTPNPSTMLIDWVRVTK